MGPSEVKIQQLLQRSHSGATVYLLNRKYEQEGDACARTLAVKLLSGLLLFCLRRWQCFE